MVVSCCFFGIKPFRFLEATPLPEVSEQPIHGFGMIFHRLLLVIALIAALPFPALFGAEEEAAAESASAGESHHGDDHKEKHHGLPKIAPVRKAVLPISSSASTWLIRERPVDEQDFSGLSRRFTVASVLGQQDQEAADVRVGKEGSAG